MDQVYLNKPIKTQTDLEQEFETKLIRTVYSMRWLYDNSHPDFNNATKNRLSWAKVATICQKPLLECTNKWNSLLHTYFTSTSSNWLHHDDLKKFEPHLHNNFRIRNQFSPANPPSQTQKNELLSILLSKRILLLSSQTTLVERQAVWSSITFRCNSLQPGAYMGALEWKKYWYEIKQNFGIQRLMLQNKLRAMGTKLDVSKYTDEDMKILKICGASTDDTLSIISRAISSNIELGFNCDLIIPKCARCLKQRNQLIIDGFCETCRNLPACDVCHSVCDSTIVKYKISTWSNAAKSLLPEELTLADEITVCVECSVELKKKATSQWKSCRICELEQPNLEFLYAANNNLRKALMNITNIAILESDGLPGYICKVCKIQVQQLNNFYTKFCRTQIKLKSIHSTQFIGNSSAILLKDGKVTYLNANEKNINKQVAPDTNEQSEAVLSTIAPALSSLPPTTTIQQKTVPAYKITKAITSGTQFKRISVQKALKTDSTPNNNGAQGDAKKRVIPINSQLAIKEIFSLQPSVLKPKVVSKQNVKVVPTTALQQAKVHGVFSNETVTVTRKTIDLPPTSPINTKQTISIVNMANGNSVKLQPASNPITLHRGFTLTKRPATITPVPAPQSESNSALTIQKEIDKIQSEAPNKIGPKPPTTTKPAIFTISDYETTEDAPPVFCIPKKNVPSVNNPAETEAEKQLLNFNPCSAPVIKTEALDHEENPNEEIPTSSSMVQEPQPQPIPLTLPSPLPAPLPSPSVSIENLPGLPPLSNEMEPTTNALGVKVIRLNGSMVAVKPHPHISGAYIPIEMCTDTPASGNRISTYIRKVDTGQPSQGGTGNSVVKRVSNISEAKQVTPQRKVPIKNYSKVQPTNLNVQYKKPNPETNTPLSAELGEQYVQVRKTHEQQQQQHPEQQQHQPPHVQTQLIQEPQQDQLQQQQQIQSQQYDQQLLKKPRKYWGNVDEFHVAPLATKTLPAPAPAPSMATTQKPNEMPPKPILQTPAAPWIEERKTPTPPEDPLSVTSAPNVRIKQEAPDNDVDAASKAKALNDTTPAMFYPDSFELEKLAFGADVSLMINNIMIQQNSIIDSNMSGNNFDKYINPAFPLSYGKRKLEEHKIQSKEICKTIKIEDDTQAESESETETETETTKTTSKKEQQDDQKSSETLKNNIKDDQKKVKIPESPQKYDDQKKVKIHESVQKYDDQKKVQIPESVQKYDDQKKVEIPESVQKYGVKLKKLRIKLKRGKGPIYVSRPKRSCTIPTKVPLSSAHSPSPATLPAAPMPTRKSLRLNQV